MGIVHRNARHLQSLVNDVLDLARIDAAQMSILPEEIDPTLLLQEAVSAARSLVEARGLLLQTSVEPALPKLWVDPNRIRQVLFNLLANAARFTERGSITVTAHLLKEQGEEVLFSVVDTGIGIAAEDMPRLFEEFRQLGGSTRRRHGGAGLGLAISKRFIELHGGRIWAESQVGQGSTFRFTLPVAHRDALTHPLLTNGTALANGLAKGGRNLLGSPNEEPILLVVTRSPGAAMFLNRYVRGCRTVIVQELEQARQEAGQLLPQAVVVDTALQEMLPHDLGELAQAWGLTSTTFLACPLPGEQPLRQRLAADGYLAKPVSRTTLWDVMHQFEDVDKVLVIDDDRDFVRLMGRLLDSPLRRYQVINAYSGQEAIELSNYHQPDLILLDLGLPDMGGAEVIARLRENATQPYAPIVVVSGAGELDMIGAVSGIVLATKPSGMLPGEIVRWVQHAVDGARGQRVPLSPSTTSPVMMDRER
jgi:CheY-like chemotaxis protein